MMLEGEARAKCIAAVLGGLDDSEVIDDEELDELVTSGDESAIRDSGIEMMIVGTVSYGMNRNTTWRLC
jgi:hypothetical protein